MQNNLLAKVILTSTAMSFMGTILTPYTARANNLVPLSFEQMYSLARSGKVEALRASVRRGMNINVMNQDGDTGLCIAAKRHDSYTYNSFRAAGANPHHPCTLDIEDYEDFINSSQTVPIGANAREAYSAMGKESFKFSPTFWWVLGGVALIGGTTAIALSGGGGGGKGDGEGGGGGGSHTEEYNSLGSIAVSKTSPQKTTSGSATNSKTISVTNDSSQISSIDLNSGVLYNTEFLKSGLLAKKGGVYSNDSDGILSLGSGTIGMIAIDDGSSVINKGYINANAYNATIAMIASEKGYAANNARGILSPQGDTYGIDLSFNGINDKDDYALIGMYADTNSIAINNGDIRGTASKATEISQEKDDGKGLLEELMPSAEQETKTEAKSSISGKIIGMEAMILNSGIDVKGKQIRIRNGENGKIYISAGDGGSETQIKLSAFGMASFLDDAFLNGIKNINRAEVVTIENTGTINLGYTGVYTAPKDTTLRKGTGGVVGIRADANTTAVNESTGLVNLNFAEYSETSDIDIGAGMQSVHGADLTNNGNIKIKTTSGNASHNYGMLSVEGSGTNSDLYTNMDQVLNNNGTITIEASNSYGIASYNGGTLNNNYNGQIIVGSPSVSSDTQYTNNVALYGSSKSSIVTLNNFGKIDVYSYKSVAMKNDYSGGQTLTNDGTINIHRSSVDSTVFGGYYSVAVNNGTINYEATPSYTGDSGGSGSSSGDDTAYDPFSSKTLTVKIGAMTTKNDASSSSTTQEIYNNKGKYINIIGSSYVSAMSVETAQGLAENNGVIYLQPSEYQTSDNVTGMYLDESTISNAVILNNGNIVSVSLKAIAMASHSSHNAAMVNNGSITMNEQLSRGMYASGLTTIINNGNINLNYTSSTAIYSLGDNAEIYNNGTITIEKNNPMDGRISNVYGILANGSENTVRNTGKINIGSYEDESTESTVSNGIGILLNSKESNNTLVVNSSTGEINVEEGTGIKVYAKSAIIENYGLINVKKGQGIENLGGEGVEIYNYGIIKSQDKYGVYSTGKNTTNEKGATILAPEAGIYNNYSEAGVKIVNNGTIGAQDNKPICGIYSKSTEADITNEGTIYASDTGIYLDNDTFANITNKGEIYASNYGIYALASGTEEDKRTIITNEGIIGSNDIKPYYGIVLKIASTDTLIKVVNTGSIVSSSYGIYLYYNYDLPDPEYKEETVVDEDGTEHKTGYWDYSKQEEIKKEEEENRIINSGTSSFGYDHKNTGSLEPPALPKANLVNSGLYSVGAVLDFDDPNISYSVGKKGTYKATALKGSLIADSSIVTGGFEDTYVNSDSLIGEDEGVNVVSASYMFDAAKETNNNGNTDIILTQKPFDDIVENSSLASFLAENYESQNGEEIFDMLKTADSKSSFASALNNQFGLNFVPNLIKQNLDAERITNSEINDDILAKTDLQNRYQSKVMIYQKEVKAKNNVIGYKDKTIGAYNFYDSVIGNNFRLGLGVAATRVDGDYDDKSTRYNNILEIFAPISAQFDAMAAVFKPKIGFGRGHYRRQSNDKFNKAQTKEYYYGFDAQAKKSIDLETVVFEPDFGLSITGMYVANSSESNNGMKLKSKNIVSALSSIGANIKKEFELNNNQAIVFGVGAKYYHEFGNRYTQKASIDNMDGYYKIASNRLKRDFCLLNLRARYNYKQFNAEVSANLPTESKHKPYYMFNLGYSF